MTISSIVPVVLGIQRHTLIVDSTASAVVMCFGSKSLKINPSIKAIESRVATKKYGAIQHIQLHVRNSLPIFQITHLKLQ